MKIALTKIQREFLEFVLNYGNSDSDTFLGREYFLKNILRYESYDESQKDKLNEVRDKYKIFWDVYKLKDGDIIHTIVNESEEAWVGSFNKTRTLKDNKNKHITSIHNFKICFNKIYCVGTCYYSKWKPFLNAFRVKGVRKATLEEIKKFNLKVKEYDNE